MPQTTNWNSRTSRSDPLNIVANTRLPPAHPAHAQSETLLPGPVLPHVAPHGIRAREPPYRLWSCHAPPGISTRLYLCLTAFNAAPQEIT
jgi:hypothetical protein